MVDQNGHPSRCAACPLGGIGGQDALFADQQGHVGHSCQSKVRLAVEGYDLLDGASNICGLRPVQSHQYLLPEVNSSVTLRLGENWTLGSTKT